MVTPPYPKPVTKYSSVLPLILNLRRDPISAWADIHFSELTVSGNSIFGYGAVTSDPIIIRHILVNNAKNYEKDKYQNRLVKPGLGTGLFTTEGEKWRTQRKAMSALFTTRMTQSYSATFHVESKKILEDTLKQNVGKTVDLAPIVSELTLNCLNGSIFRNSLPDEAAVFSSSVDRYLQFAGSLDVMDLIGVPEWFPRLSRIRGNKELRFAERAASEMLQTFQTRNSTKELSLLGALSQKEFEILDTDIKANIITFIAAGHETTSNAILWTIFLVSSHPDVLEKVLEELDQIDLQAEVSSGWYEKLPFLMACFFEAMRLYPPAAVISRQAIGADYIEGINIPKGGTIFMPPYVVHRHKKLWCKPNQFSPQRFVGTNVLNDKKFSYMPFGVGPRICIGKSFATLEGITILAMFLKHFTFSPDQMRIPEPIQKITLRSKNGFWMTVKER